MSQLRQPCLPPPKGGKDNIDWIRHRPGDTGDDFLSVGKTNSGYLVRYSEIADYHIDLPTGTVHWQLENPRRKDKKGSAIHLGKNQVLPMMLSTQELLALHASAVLLDSGEAIAFSGPSEIGKSTLAQAFSDNHSGKILADDWICITPEKTPPRLYAYSDRVEDCIAESLSTSHSKAKQKADNWHQFCLRDLARFKTRIHPLQRIFILEKGEENSDIQIQPLSAKSRYVSLAGNLFRLDSKDHYQLQKELTLLSTLLKKTAIYNLRYPRKRELMPELIQKLVSKEHC